MMAGVEELVNFLPGAALLLDTQAGILAANSGVRRLLLEHPAFNATGRMILRRAHEQILLENILAQPDRATPDRREPDAGSVTLCLKSRGGAPVLLLRLSRVALAEVKFWLVSLFDLCQSAPLQDWLLADGGLTRMQAQAVALLAEGRDMADIAERLGVKPATVRTHLKRAATRLDQPNQTQFVILLNRISASLA